MTQQMVDNLEIISTILASLFIVELVPHDTARQQNDSKFTAFITCSTPHMLTHTHTRTQILKLSALGPREYVKDSFNIFDAVIVPCRAHCPTLQANAVHIFWIERCKFPTNI